MAKKQEDKNVLFGLVGKNIAYSFSRNYFTEKFLAENRAEASYVNFDIPTIEAFPYILENHPNVKGLNVTIPYKESIIPYLNSIHKKAKKIGAVNTIKITKKGKLKGHNTDAYGFKKALQPLLQKHHKKALILGTGGASKAVAFALESLSIPYEKVSRIASNKAKYSYEKLGKKELENYTILINCTPLGTYPKVSEFPDIPYSFITPKHLLFDAVYNPPETEFLKRGKQHGATTINGLKMLEFQAEKAWKIWNT